MLRWSYGNGRRNMRRPHRLFLRYRVGRTISNGVIEELDRVWPTSEGCNDLLKDGATLVTETVDILRAVNLLPIPAPSVQQGVLDLRERQPALETSPSMDEVPTLTAKPAAADPELSAVWKSLSPVRRQLMEALTQTPQHLDQLSQRTGIPATEAGIEMIFLELDGLVRRLPGNTYIRTIG